MEGSLLLAAESSPSLGIYPWVEGKLPFSHNWSGRQRRESSAQGPQVLAWCGESHPLSSFLSNYVKKSHKTLCAEILNQVSRLQIAKEAGSFLGFSLKQLCFSVDKK